MPQRSEGSLRNSWGHFTKYRPLIRELVTRDLKVKYRRSFLGYVWSILNPLLMMLLQTLVFSYMFRFDIPNYPLGVPTSESLNVAIATAVACAEFRRRANKR